MDRSVTKGVQAQGKSNVLLWIRRDVTHQRSSVKRYSAGSVVEQDVLMLCVKPRTSKAVVEALEDRVKQTLERGEVQLTM